MASEDSKKKVVRRIKATSNTRTAMPAKRKTVAEKAPVKKAKPATSTKSDKRSRSAKSTTKATPADTKPVWIARPFIAIGHYFRDSWRELNQVQWPNRAATWKLTLAIMIFCVVIGVFVTLCDFVSQWLIEEVIL